ncbi:hypothetical protein [Faecalibacillus intestinalis]|uniref:hypothetical protein n=1 Tax=Faecalibacillus intestinalis TaxID=1982626 RepID=UPI002FD927DE
MEKLSNKGLVTIILGALMMGSVVVQCVSRIIDAILIFKNLAFYMQIVIISSISMKFKVTLRRYKWKKLQL